MTLSDYKQVLEACGEWEPLPPTGRTRHMRKWRHLYAARLHEVTGKWKFLGFDWHVFSYDHARR